MFNFAISTVPADAPALLGDGASDAIVMTKLVSFADICKTGNWGVKLYEMHENVFNNTSNGTYSRKEQFTGLLKIRSFTFMLSKIAAQSFFNERLGILAAIPTPLKWQKRTVWWRHK